MTQEAKVPEAVAVEAVAVDTTLIGKPIEKLTPAELAALTSQLANLQNTLVTRQKEVRVEAESEQFGKLATLAKEVTTALAWQKLPKLQLIPDAAGENYTVSYISTKAKAGGKKAAPDVNGGAITINKIGIAMGGIAWFRDKDGVDHEGIKELVKALKQPDGTSEAERCWDISKKGISASDIVTKYHTEEVTLVFNDGTEKLVKDCVEAMKQARAGATA